MKREEYPELYDWLLYHWKRDNHKKYQSYFEPLVENISQGQIDGFLIQMDGERRQRNIQH